MVAGIWGTLAVGIFGAGSFMTQLYGIIAVGIFVSIASGIVWYVLSLTIGLRPTEEEEELGLDKSELGLEAYPDFTR